MKHTTEKPIATSIIAHRYTCDICKAEIANNGGTFYTTCTLCKKDCCPSHIRTYSSMTYSDRYGDYPPLCSECMAPYSASLKRIQQIENEMEHKLCELQSPIEEDLERRFKGERSRFA